MKEILGFIEPLRKQLMSSLRSVVLFGSSSDLKEMDRKSEYDLLFIIDDFGPEESGIFKLWKRKLPRWFKYRYIIMSKEDLLNSSDVFPIEYKDILDKYKLIFGEDVLKELTLSDENLRHQLEYELRAKKQRFLVATIDMMYTSKEFRKEFSSHCKSLIILSNHFLRIIDDEDLKEKIQKKIQQIRSLMDTKPDFDSVGQLISVYNNIIRAVDKFFK